MLVNTLEERVMILEQEMLQLKRQLNMPLTRPWWDIISGVFANTPAFQEALDLGRQYREAQHPGAGDIAV